MYNVTMFSKIPGEFCPRAIVLLKLNLATPNTPRTKPTTWLQPSLMAELHMLVAKSRCQRVPQQPMRPPARSGAQPPRQLNRGKEAMSSQKSLMDQQHDKRAAEDKARERKEQAAQDKRERESATHGLRHKQVAAPQPLAQRKQSGEISALWWLNMGI